MRKIKLALYVMGFYLLFLQDGMAQGSTHKLDSVLTSYLTKQLNLNIRKFKDSTNLYSFAIKINITKINNQSIRIDSISSNNPVIACIFFGNLQGIRILKYANIENYRKIKVIKPVSILIGSRPVDESIEDVFLQNCRLFYLSTSNKPGSDFNYRQIYLSPLISVFDLKVYE
jgi:hypothetical protein